MDIKETIDKISKDKELQEKLKKDPVKTVEGLMGVDLPDGMVDKVVAGVMTKMSTDKLGGILGKLGK